MESNEPYKYYNYTFLGVEIKTEKSKKGNLKVYRYLHYITPEGVKKSNRLNSSLNVIAEYEPAEIALCNVKPETIFGKKAKSAFRRRVDTLLVFKSNELQEAEWAKAPRPIPANFSDLVGKTLLKIEIGVDDFIVFYCDNGAKYKLFHKQKCRETVVIEDICGDMDDLIGSPILVAEEASNKQKRPDGVKTKTVLSIVERLGTTMSVWQEIDTDGNPCPESATWTFYKIATFKGYVTIRFYGSSNGYYSESVSFEKDDRGNFYKHNYGESNAILKEYGTL